MMPNYETAEPCDTWLSAKVKKKEAKKCQTRRLSGLVFLCSKSVVPRTLVTPTRQTSIKDYILTAIDTKIQSRKTLSNTSDVNSDGMAYSNRKQEQSSPTDCRNSSVKAVIDCNLTTPPVIASSTVRKDVYSCRTLLDEDMDDRRTLENMDSDNYSIQAPAHMAHVEDGDALDRKGHAEDGDALDRMSHVEEGEEDVVHSDNIGCSYLCGHSTRFSGHMNVRAPFLSADKFSVVSNFESTNLSAELVNIFDAEDRLSADQDWMGTAKVCDSVRIDATKADLISVLNPQECFDFNKEPVISCKTEYVDVAKSESEDTELTSISDYPIQSIKFYNTQLISSETDSVASYADELSLTELTNPALGVTGNITGFGSVLGTENIHLETGLNMISDSFDDSDNVVAAECRQIVAEFSMDLALLNEYHKMRVVNNNTEYTQECLN